VWLVGWSYWLINLLTDSTVITVLYFGYGRKLFCVQQNLSLTINFKNPEAAICPLAKPARQRYGKKNVVAITSISAFIALNKQIYFLREFLFIYDILDFFQAGNGPAVNPSG